MNAATRSHFAMAFASVRRSKVKSFLTTLGIVISVTSIISIVSLGEGAKKQVQDSLTLSSRQHILLARTGKIVERNNDNSVRAVDFFAAINATPFTTKDIEAVQKTPGVSEVLPFAKVSLPVKSYQGMSSNKAVVIATSPALPNYIDQPMYKGSFFTTTQKNTVVLGKKVAESLFSESNPLGRTIVIGDQSFTISGIFEQFKSTPLFAGVDLNNSIFVPFDTIDKTDSILSIYQMLIATVDFDDSVVATAVSESIMQSRSGSDDFTIITPKEISEIVQMSTRVLSSFITIIAIISFLVGGIGIMNILFVSVSERIKEIGIRKSLGATNAQIYNQFLAEAVILSVTGAAMGVIMSMIVYYLVLVTTPVVPIIEPWSVVAAVGISIATGVVFGTIPAIKAARKDPIESLRREQ